MKVKNYHHRYHWKIYCDDNSSFSSIILINLFASFVSCLVSDISSLFFVVLSTHPFLSTTPISFFSLFFFLKKLSAISIASSKREGSVGDFHFPPRNADATKDTKT